jgi:hypothetical protein
MSKVFLTGKFRCNSCNKEFSQEVPIRVSLDGFMFLDQEKLKYSVTTCSMCQSDAVPYFNQIDYRFDSGRYILQEITDLRKELKILREDVSRLENNTYTDKALMLTAFKGLEARLAPIENAVGYMQALMND